MRGLQDGSRIYCPNSVLKTRAAWNSGSWRISDTAFDLCLQIDDGIANRLRAANQDIALSGFVERLRCVGHTGTARLTAVVGTPQPASAAFICGFGQTRASASTVRSGLLSANRHRQLTPIVR